MFVSFSDEGGTFRCHQTLPAKQKPTAPFQTTYSTTKTNMEGNTETMNEDEFHWISY